MIGISSALWLQRAGQKVVVIDPHPPGTGASHGNAGCFNGSSVVPMSMPGIWTSVPRWMLDPLGPLSIRLAYMPTLFPWLWRFLRAGRREEVRKQAAALRALLGPTLPYLKQLVAGVGVDDLIREQGHLYVYGSEKALAGDHFAWELRRDAGVQLDLLDRRQLREFDPALSSSYTNGVLIRENGHTTDPGGLVLRLAEHFVRQGGTIHRAKATGFRLDGGQLQFIETEDGTVPADSAVIAAGAHSKALLKMLGDWVPLETERGYHVMISDPESQPRVPTCDASSKFITTPMKHGLRLAGTVELAGFCFITFPCRRGPDPSGAGFVPAGHAPAPRGLSAGRSNRTSESTAISLTTPPRRGRLAGSVGKPAVSVVVASFPLPQPFLLPLLLLQALGLLHPLAFLGLPAFLQTRCRLGQRSPVDPLRCLP
jgi:D-amino-acid dehydrogenase